MSGTNFGALVAAAVLVAAVLGSHHHDVTKVLKVAAGKDARCHNPLIHMCNTSVYEIMDWKLSGWFYHSMFKSCRPVYSEKGLHVCTENQDLPKTREECENLCGDSCSMSNGSKGICVYDQLCKVYNDRVVANPRPCGSHNVNCCPKISDSNLMSTDYVGDKNMIVKNVSTDNSFGTYYIYRIPYNKPINHKRIF